MVFRVDVHVFVVDCAGRNVNLYVASASEVEGFAFGKFDYKLFDEGCNVVVAQYLALPLLDAEDFFGYLYLHVFFYLDLTAQTVVFLLLFSREVRLFGRQHLAASFQDFTFTHSASALSSAG